MRAVANLGFLFQELPLLERYAKAAAAGFKWVELPLPYSEEASELRKAADHHGLRHSLINAPAGDWASGQRGLAAITRHEDFAPTIAKSIEYCLALDCRRLHVMAGKMFSDESSKSLYFGNIALACEMCEKQGIQVFVEPICRAAIEGYFLSSFDQVKELVQKGIKVAVLLDYFHAQQICGSLTETTRSLGDLVKYVQVAQVPSRHEPSFEGEIDFHYLFKMMRDNGLAEVFVGCEYVPSKDHDFSWISKFCLEF